MRRATFTIWGLAGLLALSSFMASRIVRADEPISDEARRHFKAGVAYLLDPDGERAEDAYREFKAAYAISKSAKILGNMGLCALKLERDGEAIDAYSTYLREVQDIDATERDQIVRDLQTLTVGVVRVALTIDPPGSQVVDVRVPNRGDRITNIYAATHEKTDLGLRPGHHEITVKLPGYAAQTWEFEAHAGGREQHLFKLVKSDAAPGTAAVVVPAPAKPPAHRSTVVPWVIAGVGVAVVATGAVTGILALAKVKDLEKSCPNNVCPASYATLEDDRRSARSMSTATDVLLIGGALVAATGVTWALLANRSDSDAAPALSAACTGAGCAGSLRVWF